MKVYNFCLPIFNRATYCRLASLIHAMEEDPLINVTLLLSSGLLQDQYGDAQKIIKREHTEVDYHEVKVGEYSGKARTSLVSADITKGMATFLEDKEFDAILVTADRFETLPAAMVATYMGFITIHLQGGEVTGNIDERIRHACTKLADYHFVATKMAKYYVLDMGEEGYTVHRTGCPSLDLIKNMGIRRYTPDEKYFICMFHPDTQSIDTQYKETETLLKAVVDFCMKHGVTCHWYWPNPDSGRDEILKLLDVVKQKYGPYIKKFINQEPFIFLRKLSGAKFIIGNSSVALREASYLGVPAINIGNRQNMRERSWNVIDIKCDYEAILGSMLTQYHAKRYGASYLYGDTKSALRIIRTLKDIEYVKKGPLNYPLRPKYMEDHIGEKRFRSHKIGVVTGPKRKTMGSGKGQTRDN